MSGVGGLLLSINTGSSSIKCDVYGMNGVAYAHLELLGIAQGECTSTVKIGDANISAHYGEVDYEEALSIILRLVGENVTDAIAAVGHRIVYGGPDLKETLDIDDGVVQTLYSHAYIDPTHAPQALRAIERFKELYPHARHYACFDTGFFRDMPDISTRLAIPKDWHDLGIRRHGFHGLSYQYLLEKFRQECGDLAAQNRIIMLHLGSGVSAMACHHGQPVDTTMSYTPNSGVMMSTRSGDLGPDVYWQMTQRGMAPDEVKDILSTRSGLLGVSELSADMYTLLETEHERPQSKLAVDMFCAQIKKSIAGLASGMGGVDSVIISGGMGERAPRIRNRILKGLEFMGIELDDARNNNGDELISSEGSRVGVHVYHTDESMTIFREGLALLGKDQKTKEN